MRHSDIAHELDIDYSAIDCERVGEVEYFVQHCTDYVRVRFRGTEGSKLISGLGILDVFRDLRIFPWHDDRILGSVHAGILKGARKVVDRRLKRDLSKDLPIRFEGHSMGGGLAQVAHALMAAEGYLIAGSVALAPPRIFSTPPLLHGAVWYRNGCDPVTQVPLRIPGINFSQAGEFRHIGNRSGRFWRVSDHPCSAYYQSLLDVGF